jgi:putative addiction module antidote
MGADVMERKVTKIGNSLGVTFPSEVLKSIHVKLGDEVTIDVKDDEIIIKKSRKVQLPSGISPDFFDILNETMSNYDETIKGLRDR